MRLPFTFMLLVAAASQVGATDCGQITRDQGFDLWCGEVLCTWKLERGEIRKVGTWNKGDTGVEMVGDDVAFEQLTPVTSGDTTCIRFDLVANVEETAQVELHADVFGDGSVDFSERLPTSHWKPVSFVIPVRAPYNGIRFELTKHGSGKAVLAQLQAETANGECDGLEPIVPAPAPLGGFCNADAQCASGMCRTVGDPEAYFGLTQMCVGCDPALGATACTGGDVCGFGVPASNVLEMPYTCVPPASAVLGEVCASDEECATGVCNALVCSTCSPTAPCVNESCNAAYPEGPYLCGAGQHERLTNEPCATDSDCAGGHHCVGAPRKQCESGRACTTPEQCPIDDGLAPGACDAVGIEGGHCD